MKSKNNCRNELSTAKPTYQRHILRAEVPDLHSHYSNFEVPLIDEYPDMAVTANLDTCKQANLKFIIDTRARYSIIKYSDIRKGTIVTKDDFKIYGLIRDQHVTAIGKMSANIALDEILLKHTFFIIQEEIYVPYNGILGADFLSKFNAEIQYSKKLMKLQIEVDGDSGSRKDATTSTDDIDFYQIVNLETFGKQAKLPVSILKESESLNTIQEHKGTEQKLQSKNSKRKDEGSKRIVPIGSSPHTQKKMHNLDREGPISARRQKRKREDKLPVFKNLSKAKIEDLENPIAEQKNEKEMKSINTFQALEKKIKTNSEELTQHKAKHRKKSSRVKQTATGRTRNKLRSIRAHLYRTIRKVFKFKETASVRHSQIAR